MPWCDDCDKFLSPNTVRDDGTCPTCGSTIIAPRSLERARKGRGSSPDAQAVRAARRASASPEPGKTQDDEAGRTPWHFWVLLAALVVYLGWRLIQGIIWVGSKL